MPWSENTANFNKQKKHQDNDVDLTKVSYVFVIFALISFATAFFFNLDKGKIIRDSFTSQSDATSGPIYVKKHRETYDIEVTANIAKQSWAFIEGEVLDSEGEYLFAFGKELWRESGCDYDGCWQEVDNNYNIKVTFPNPGKYYLKFQNNSEAETHNSSAYGGAGSNISYTVAVSKKNGSSLPHLWFGIFNVIIAIGIFFYEERKKLI